MSTLNSGTQKNFVIGWIALNNQQIVVAKVICKNGVGGDYYHNIQKGTAATGEPDE